MSSSPTPAPGYEFEPHSRRDPLVLVSLASVCILIILVGYYKIIKRLWCGVGAVTSSTNQVQSRDLNEFVFQDSLMQIQIHGLESSITHSLPINQFEKKKNEDESRSCNNECAVCLGEFQEGEWLKHLPNCTHVFHIACIDTWFQSHSNCPLCRSHVYNLSLYYDCTSSTHTLLDAPRREDFLEERAAHYPALRLETLQNQGI